MFDAISPSETQPTNLAAGRAEIAFALQEGRTRLAHLFQHEPLRVLFPTPASGDCIHAALVTTSGGLVSGDAMSVAVQAGPGAVAQIAPSAAEKIYRSADADCRIDVALSAEAGAWLEWLPQETILFDGARLRRTTRIDAAPDARALAGEMLVFGRIGRGESLTHGLVRDAWEVRLGGRLVWADVLLLDGDTAVQLAHPAGLDGATAAATAIYVGPDAETHIGAARAMLDESVDVRCAATVVNGMLVVRWLGRDARALRAAFGAFWARFRNVAGALPAVLPRLWHV